MPLGFVSKILLAPQLIHLAQVCELNSVRRDDGEYRQDHPKVNIQQFD